MATLRRKTVGYVTEQLRGSELANLTLREKVVRTLRFTRLEAWATGFAVVLGTVALIAGVFELNRPFSGLGDPDVDGLTIIQAWTRYGNFNGLLEVLDWAYFGGVASIVCGCLLYFFAVVGWAYALWRKTFWPMWYLVFVWLSFIVAVGATVFSLTVALAIFS